MELKLSGFFIIKFSNQIFRSYIKMFKLKRKGGGGRAIFDEKLSLFNAQKILKCPKQQIKTKT